MLIEQNRGLTISFLGTKLPSLENEIPKKGDFSHPIMTMYTNIYPYKEAILRYTKKVCIFGSNESFGYYGFNITHLYLKYRLTKIY